MLTAIENVLNRGLPQSPRAQALCRELAGKKLAIEMPEVARVLVESTGDVLRIRGSDAKARQRSGAALGGSTPGGSTPGGGTTSGGLGGGTTGGSTTGGSTTGGGTTSGTTGGSTASGGATGGEAAGASIGAEAADAEIIGGPFGLLALGGDTPEAVLQRRGVEIRGDAAIAQRFRELGMLLRPDLEEALARVIGDVPAHQIGRFSRLAFSWGQRAAATTMANISEYLAHERRDLVPRNEGEQFLRGVDTLREDVDRLEARLDLLTRA